MNKETILLVEDEREILNVLSVILRHYRFEVLTAENGLDALAIIKKEHIDIIVCDIRLPDITGHDILSAVRNDKKVYRTPFIFLTAFTDEKDIRKGMNEGADDYITKPFASKELVKTIKARLALKNKNSVFYDTEIDEKWLTVLNNNFQHEFLTPLKSLFNASYTMESSIEGDKAIDAKDVIHSIGFSAFKMMRGIRNLLTYANLIKEDRSNQSLIKGSGCILSDLLIDIIHIYNDDINLPKIESEIDYINDKELSNGYLVIIFTELIDNAIKFNLLNFDYSLPFVKLSSKKNGFELTVENTVSDELFFELKDIHSFRKFHEDQNIDGLGLGLYICRELCKKLGYGFTLNIERGKIRFIVSYNN